MKHRKKVVKGKTKNKTKQSHLTNNQLCHLKARYFTLSAQVAINDRSYINTYRKIGSQTAQLISADIVLQYLESRNLILTLETAKTESSQDLNRNLEDLWIARKLKVRGRRDIIHGLLQAIKDPAFPTNFQLPSHSNPSAVKSIQPRKSNQLKHSSSKSPKQIKTPPPNLTNEKTRSIGISNDKPSPKKNSKSKVKNQNTENAAFKITANLVSTSDNSDNQMAKQQKRKKAKKKSSKKEIIELNESIISPPLVENSPEPVKRKTKAKKAKKSKKSTKIEDDISNNFFINYNQMHSSDDQDNDEVDINLDELPPPLGTDSSDEYDEDNEDGGFDSADEYRYNSTVLQREMNPNDNKIDSNKHKSNSQKQKDEEQAYPSLKSNEKRKYINDVSHFYTYTYEAEEEEIENKSESTQYEYPTHIYEYEDYDDEEESNNHKSNTKQSKDNINFSPIVGNSLITGEIEINSQDLINPLSTEIEDSKPAELPNNGSDIVEPIENNNTTRKTFSLEHNVDIQSNEKKSEENQLNENNTLPPNKVLLVFQTFHKVDVEPDTEQQRMFKLQKGKISSSEPSPSEQNQVTLSPPVVANKEVKDYSIDNNDYVVHVKIVEAEISTNSKFKSSDFKVRIKLGSVEEYAETQKSSPSIKTIVNSKGAKDHQDNFSAVYYSWNETFTIFCNNINEEKIVVSTLASETPDEVDSFEIVSIAMIPTRSFQVGDISDVWVNMKNTGRLHLLICLGYFEGEEEEEEEECT